ncbi:hypothetical protein ACFVUS_24180 [Nocardia sp. NPDC058058]|uniref:hypothetical protein n=1 Tax=Nocardia sp. NPDC058058 TaxID=3346317 RepID=UPI0036DC1288
MALYKLSPEVHADNADKTWDATTTPRTLLTAVFSVLYPITTELFSSGIGGLYGVTESLAAALAATDLTGYRLVPATGRPSEFADDSDTLTIPAVLYALDIYGRGGIDDIARPQGFVLSRRAADFFCDRDPDLATTRREVDAEAWVVRRSIF